MKNSAEIKRMIAALLLALMTALPLCGCVQHKHIVVESRWVGDFCFAVYEDGTVDITAYRGEEEYLKLPNRLGDFTVIGFGPKTFDGCKTIKQVLIPPTVTSLPAKLFNSCPNLESAYIPDSVKSIGKNMIFDCPSFTTVMYSGSQEEWNAIDLGATPWTDNYLLVNSEIVYDFVLDRDD